MLSAEKTDLRLLDTCSKQIAMRLRAVRKEAGFKTGKSFAEKYSIPLTTYSQHETGKRRISAETLIDYSIKLNANVGWILMGAGNPWEKQQPIEKRRTTLQTDVPRENLSVLKQVFLSAQSFLNDEPLSFSEWVERCLEIGAVLITLNIDNEKIEKIVRLLFSKLS